MNCERNEKFVDFANINLIENNSTLFIFIENLKSYSENTFFKSKQEEKTDDEIEIEETTILNLMLNSFNEWKPRVNKVLQIEQLFKKNNIQTNITQGLISFFKDFITFYNFLLEEIKLQRCNTNPNIYFNYNYQNKLLKTFFNLFTQNNKKITEIFFISFYNNHINPILKYLNDLTTFILNTFIKYKDYNDYSNKIIFDTFYSSLENPNNCDNENTLNKLKFDLMKFLIEIYDLKIQNLIYGIYDDLFKETFIDQRRFINGSTNKDFDWYKCFKISSLHSSINHPSVPKIYNLICFKILESIKISMILTKIGIKFEKNEEETKKLFDDEIKIKDKEEEEFALKLIQDNLKKSLSFFEEELKLIPFSLNNANGVKFSFVNYPNFENGNKKTSFFKKKLKICKFPNFTKIDKLLQKRIFQKYFKINSNLNQILKNFFLKENNLENHFRTVFNICLMKDSSLINLFVSDLMKTNHLIDNIALYSIFSKTLKNDKFFKISIENEFNAIELFNDQQIFFNNQKMINIKYSPEMPFNIFFSSTENDYLTQIFNFLLQIKILFWFFKKIGKIEKSSNFAFSLLFFKISNFLKNFEFYVFVDVIDTRIDKFLKEYENYTNIDNLIKNHQNLYKEIISFLFIKNKNFLLLFIKLKNFLSNFAKIQFVQENQTNFLKNQLLPEFEEILTEFELFFTKGRKKLTIN